MALLHTLSFKEFEDEYINKPEELDQKMTILDCRIDNFNGQVYLQMFVFCLWRLFDGKFGAINVNIETKEQLEKVSKFFQENKQRIIDSIPKEMESNLIVNLEEDYQEELEMLS